MYDLIKGFFNIGAKTFSTLGNTAICNEHTWDGGADWVVGGQGGVGTVSQVSQDAGQPKDDGMPALNYVFT